MNPDTVLVTGGAGFIGSHCCVDLLNKGYKVVVIDNLVNSHVEVIDRIRELGGAPVSLHRLDLNDTPALLDVLRRHAIDAVIHFAAHKAVSDSIDRPLDYYSNNVSGLLSLMGAMREVKINRLIFSSSCSIYGESAQHVLTEAAPAQPTNPYARSKWMCEQILEDLCRRYPDLSVTALRYFNPAGAHESGRLGEDPLGVPSNIIPYLAQLAAGRYEEVKVFGGDYPTPDGTAVRDYIHVVDVAEAHSTALTKGPRAGFRRYNLGTGIGTSVLEVIKEFSAVSGLGLVYRLVDRRPGDVAQLVASSDLAQRDLGWKARRTVTNICSDAWRFQVANPWGFAEPVAGIRRPW